MPRTLAGSCLCGAVTFTLSGRIDGFFLCHCARCRKDSGSAHAANIFAAEAAVTWHKGSDLLRSFRLPDTRHTKSFCRECGSALPTVKGSAAMIPAGCLDTIPALRPDAHIFCAHRAEWDRDLEAVPAYDGLPGEASGD